MQSDVASAEIPNGPYRTPGSEILAEGPSPQQGEQIVRLATGILLVVPLLLGVAPNLQTMLEAIDGRPLDLLRALTGGLYFVGSYAVSCTLGWFLVRGSTGARWIAVAMCVHLVLAKLMSLSDQMALYMANEVPTRSGSAVAIALLVNLAPLLAYVLVGLLLTLPASVGAFFEAARRRVSQPGAVAVASTESPVTGV